MGDRSNISSGAHWEDIVEYSRAVKVGNVLEISGTVAVRDSQTIGKWNPYLQAHCVLEVIEGTLAKAGVSLKDVLRTRMSVTDISDWELISKARGEVFEKIKPTTIMIEVNKLIDPDYLVEIEATAIIP